MILDLAHQLVLVDRRLEAAPQRPLDAFVEIVEQRCLPRIPELRVGPAHVGAGQHVQIVQMNFVADLACELVDDLRVADIVLLRRHREQQMILTSQATSRAS